MTVGSSMSIVMITGVKEKKMTAVMRSAIQESVINTREGRSLEALTCWEEVDSGKADIAGEAEMMTAP